MICKGRKIRRGNGQEKKTNGKISKKKETDGKAAKLSVGAAEKKHRRRESVTG